MSRLLTGVLATSRGEGPANATAVLMIERAGGNAINAASGKVARDGSLYLVLPPAIAQQYAGQSAAIEIVVGGKPLAAGARVTVQPGHADVTFVASADAAQRQICFAAEARQ